MSDRVLMQVNEAYITMRNFHIRHSAFRWLPDGSQITVDLHGKRIERIRICSVGNVSTVIETLMVHLQTKPLGYSTPTCLAS